jgi:thymidylate synthase
MKHPETQYLELLDECLVDGIFRNGRNGGTHGLFGRQIRFDLNAGFPLLTTKKINFHAIVVELLWFLRGDTNIAFLHEHGVRIWDEWADGNGDLGPIYGKQWRTWTGWFGKNIDQITKVIDGLKRDPFGRRHIVTAWNPAEIDDMALPPCHCLFQFFVGGDGKLSCQLYQRSADIFLGVPFNIASYALLTHLIAREIGRSVGEFIHTFGDVHLYDNHVEQAAIQLDREPRPFPTLNLPIRENHVGIFDLAPAAITLDGYNPHPAIAAPVSV